MESIQPVKLDRLQKQFGKEVELSSEDGQVEIFMIKAEFQLGSHFYAALQSNGMREADELAFFRIIESANGELSLVSIDSEEEWEDAAEGYDELIFSALDPS